MAKRTTIRCPHCGCEYLPGEIYLPNEFLGQPKDICRDEKGNVLLFKGNDMNTAETFYCYECNKSFAVNATVTFKTTPLVDMFEEDDKEFGDLINK